MWKLESSQKDESKAQSDDTSKLTENLELIMVQTYLLCFFSNLKSKLWDLYFRAALYLETYNLRRPPLKLTLTLTTTALEQGETWKSRKVVWKQETTITGCYVIN